MTGTPPDQPSIYCRKCRYVLDGLPENRCPECGTAFDPEDSATLWAPRDLAWQWEAVVALLCVPLAWTAAGLQYRGGPPAFETFLPGILGMGFGIGLGISGCRRGRSGSRVASLIALVLVFLEIQLFLEKWMR